jgi:hypothetical protein
LIWFSRLGSFLVGGVVLDVVAEVGLGAEAETMAQILWPVAGGGLC